MKTLELTCRDCGHCEVCRPVQIVARLQAIGMLRRLANPEPDLLEELLYGSLSRLACRSCGHMGLQSAEYVEEDWVEDRLCEVCGKQIPATRLEVFPSAKRCVDCSGDP